MLLMMMMMDDADNDDDDDVKDDDNNDDEEDDDDDCWCWWSWDLRGLLCIICSYISSRDSLSTYNGVVKGQTGNYPDVCGTFTNIWTKYIIWSKAKAVNIITFMWTTEW